MFLSEKQIEQLLQNKFSIDFVKIVLIQQVADNPRIYTGPGTIYQNGDGKLKLKLYHAFKNHDDMIEHIQSRMSHQLLTPGKLISKEHYFSLEAQAMDGFVWTSENIWYSGNISLPSVGAVVETNLNFLINNSQRYEKEDKSRFTLKAIIPGKFVIPCNEVEEIDGGFSRNTFREDINELSLDLVKKEGYLSLSYAKQAGANFELQSKLIYEALGVGIGKVINPIYQIVASGESRTTTIYSKNTNTEQHLIPPPIPTNIVDDATYLKNFIGGYISKIPAPFGPFYGFWYRIVKASSGDILNSALVGTTAIEGVLNEYYKEKGNPDREFIEQLDEARKALKTIQITERVMSRLEGSMNIAKSFSAKNAMYSLNSDGLITEHMIKTWNKLRNKAAHGYTIKNTDEELQILLDDSYTCYALYYKLLLIYIGYDGDIIDYSLPKWPKTTIGGQTIAEPSGE